MTTAPKGAKKPADYKQAAAKREANGITVVDVEFAGKTYTLPAELQDWPVKVARAYEAGSQTTAAALLLESIDVDPDDWTVRRLQELFNAYGQVAGFDEGE